MNENLTKELAAIEDELAKLKPAVEHIESASKIVEEAEAALTTYRLNIERLFNSAESAFKEQMDAQVEAAKEMLKDTKKTLADYTDEFERNVREQVDTSLDILEQADEVIAEAREVEESTKELVQSIYSMKLNQKLMGLLVTAVAILVVVLILLNRYY